MTDPQAPLALMAAGLSAAERSAVSQFVKPAGVSEIDADQKAYNRLRRLKLCRGIYSLDDKRFVVASELGWAVRCVVKPDVPPRTIQRKPLAVRAIITGE